MPLGKKADAGDYIKDFTKSKAPQFKGKSKKKRKEMAIAAYLSKKDEAKEPAKGTGKKPKGSSRRLYTDENPKDTVSVKFSSRQDIVDTLNKKSFKAKPHVRQSQIINLIHQRVRAAYGRAKDPEVKKRLKSALDYAEQRKEASKKKTERLKKVKEGKGYGPGSIGSRYRAVYKKNGKFYYEQEDALGQGIRQTFGPYKTKAAALRKMQTFPPARNYRDITELKKMKKENIDPSVQKKHKGKSAPFGSAYELVKELVLKEIQLVKELNCKYGTYFCPHDKVYKCRKGPKKSKSNEGVHDPMNPGILKKRLGTLSCSKVP